MIKYPNFISGLYSFFVKKELKDKVELKSDFQVALSLIGKEELIGFDYEATLIYEFQYLSEQVKKTCHQLDYERKTIQFAETNKRIGQDLLYGVKFIHGRYRDSWTTLMGLLMILLYVFETESEVQHQLLQVSYLGREIMQTLNLVLKNPKQSFSLTNSKEFSFICLLNHSSHWYEVLTIVIEKLAYRDPLYESEYYHILVLANQFSF